MKPGPRPGPTKLKVLKGNPGKRALNEDEPEIPPGMPDQPDFLNKDALEEWDRITSQLLTLGLLTKVDRVAISAYCQAYGRWASAERDILENGVIYVSPKTGFKMQSPMLAISNKAMEQMLKFLVEFGMTPSSRSRVTVDKKGKTKEKGFKKLGKKRA